MKFRGMLSGLAACAIATALLTVGGCARKTQHIEVVNQVPPDQFAWVNQVLSATGAGTASELYTHEPQKTIAAKQNAKTAAISDLKKQVRLLPVAQEKSLGEVMDGSIGIKRAVEKHLQTAQVVSEAGSGAGMPAEYQVTVTLPLAPLAEILKQHYITPDELPDEPERDKPDVPPVV